MADAREMVSVPERALNFSKGSVSSVDRAHRVTMPMENVKRGIVETTKLLGSESKMRITPPKQS